MNYLDLAKTYDVFKPEKFECPIHIIGCGAVGSTVGEMLARTGVTNVHLWDFDTVEPHNITNQVFRQRDIGKTKVEALKGIMTEINPELEETIVLHDKGWTNERLEGFIFLAPDNIDIRRAICEGSKYNRSIKAIFDFRMGLYDAQHLAADWSDPDLRDNLIASMQFKHEDVKDQVSACNITLAVVPTVRMICSIGVANFQNFWNGKPIKRLVLIDTQAMMVDAF